jgi:hypothetical protein
MKSFAGRSSLIDRHRKTSLQGFYIMAMGSSNEFFSCALIVHYIGTFIVMLVIETNICNDIPELMITATYNGILFSVFRDLESRDPA